MVPRSWQQPQASWRWCSLQIILSTTTASQHCGPLYVPSTHPRLIVIDNLYILNPLCFWYFLPLLQYLCTVLQLYVQMRCIRMSLTVWPAAENVPMQRMWFWVRSAHCQQRHSLRRVRPFWVRKWRTLWVGDSPFAGFSCYTSLHWAQHPVRQGLFACVAVHRCSVLRAAAACRAVWLVLHSSGCVISHRLHEGGVHFRPSPELRRLQRILDIRKLPWLKLTALCEQYGACLKLSRLRHGLSRIRMWNIISRWL